MQVNRFHKRNQELLSPKGQVLTRLHLAAWNEMKGLSFGDQSWVMKELMTSIKKRQEMHYCVRCHAIDCQCKRPVFLN